MYINSSEPTLSFRTAKFKDKDLVIIGGGNHKTGFAPESDDNYGYDFDRRVSDLLKYHEDEIRKHKSVKKLINYVLIVTGIIAVIFIALILALKIADINDLTNVLKR